MNQRLTVYGFGNDGLFEVFICSGCSGGTPAAITEALQEALVNRQSK